MPKIFLVLKSSQVQALPLNKPLIVSYCICQERYETYSISAEIPAPAQADGQQTQNQT